MKQRCIGDLVTIAPNVFCVVSDVTQHFYRDKDGIECWYDTLVLVTPSGVVTGLCDDEYIKDV